MFLTTIIFIIILGILVFVHEFGHFIVAKKSGMKVLEFGFGFPPRLIGFQKTDGGWRVIIGHRSTSQSQTASPPAQGGSLSAPGEGNAENTIYSINAIPLGGFVKIWGENNEHEDDPRSFINRPFFHRLTTLVAGVAMNWVLAVVLFTIAFMAGILTELTPDLQNSPNVKISQRQIAINGVLENSPAEKAGLKPQDIILSLDGQKFEAPEELVGYIKSRKGQAFEFIVQRVGETKKIQVESLTSPPGGEGPTGIVIINIAKIRLPFLLAAQAGLEQTWYLTKGIFVFLGQLFQTKEVLESVGGPVKIAQIVGQVRQLGVVPLVQLTGFLSANLAVLNLLPFPALDGGRVLFLLIEKIRGKRNNQKIEQWFNTAGFVFLILLMVLVTFKDIRGI